jgi:hypothetical protein
MITAIVVAACGGGEGESAPEPAQQSTGPGPLDEGGIICEVAAILFGGECVGIDNLPNCASDPYNNPLGLPRCDATETSTSTGDSWITPFVYGSSDIEFNNDLSSASPADLYSRLPSGRGGFLVDSTFNSTSDPADVFVITLTNAANIEFSLCFTDSTCSYSAFNRIDVATAYISILDQDGAIVWSAADDTEQGNLREIWLEAGIPYFIMLVAEDTMGSDLGYRFKAVEAQSQVRPTVVPTATESPEPRPEAPILNLTSSGGAPGIVSISLEWLPPTLNDDGTALVDLSGYVIHYGNMAGGAFDASITLSNPGLTAYSFELGNNDYILAITAVNAAGVESDYSNTVNVGHTPEVEEDFVEPTPQDDGTP